MYGMFILIIGSICASSYHQLKFASLALAFGNVARWPFVGMLVVVYIDSTSKAAFPGWDR